MSGRRCPEVETILFYGHPNSFVAECGEFLKQELCYRGFIPGNRFNVDELASECNDIHGHISRIQGKRAKEKAPGQERASKLAWERIGLYC
jgi:hypothetical protein